MPNEDWSPPSDATLDTGKPIIATNHRRIRDLTAAAFRGAPNSPSLSPWAAARAPVTAGDVPVLRDPLIMVFVAASNRGTNENVALSGTMTPAYRVGLMNDGTVRVKWTQGRSSRGASGGPLAQIGRVRAGVYAALSSEIANDNNAAQESKSYDATIQAGDTIVWLLRSSTNGQEMQIYNFELATTGDLLHAIEPFVLVGAAPT
jgi:hypothetical protein